MLLRMRQAIVEGETPPGSTISEPELYRGCGLGRGARREAIGRPEACGLVARRANIGARVVSLASEQLLEICRVCEAPEGMAARLAAVPMSESERSDRRQLLAEAEHNQEQPPAAQPGGTAQ